MIRPAALVILLTASIPAIPCLAQPNAHCYAFLLKGDVWLTCNGRKTQLTHSGKISDFAISNDSAQFAFSIEHLVEPSPVMPEYASTATVIGLTSRRERLIRNVGTLLTSCGTLMTVRYPAKKAPVFRDARTGEEVRFPPYVQFRCSSDRTKLVGFTRIGKSALMEGISPRRQIASEDTWSFSISPNGSEVAYNNDDTLCVASGQQEQHCINANVLGGDPPFINDGGEVLVAQGTGKECHFKGSKIVSPKPFRGSSSQGQCPGVGYWHYGLNSLQMLEPVGVKPQWVSFPVADLLLNWTRISRKPAGVARSTRAKAGVD